MDLINSLMVDRKHLLDRLVGLFGVVDGVCRDDDRFWGSYLAVVGTIKA